MSRASYSRNWRKALFRAHRDRKITTGAFMLGEALAWHLNPADHLVWPTDEYLRDETCRPDLQAKNYDRSIRRWFQELRGVGLVTNYDGPVPARAKGKADKVYEVTLPAKEPVAEPKPEPVATYTNVVPLPVKTTPEPESKPDCFGSFDRERDACVGGIDEGGTHYRPCPHKADCQGQRQLGQDRRDARHGSDVSAHQRMLRCD